MGSTLSFARTRAERDQSDDPPSSIGERYGPRAAYRDAGLVCAGAGDRVLVGLSC